MRVAIVQMNSTDDLPANMAAAERFVDEAAALVKHVAHVDEALAARHVRFFYIKKHWMVYDFKKLLE